jgi:hypothetical protein
MEAEELHDALRQRGHTIGRSAVSHDGFLLLNVDGRMMKCIEAEELLKKETSPEYFVKNF